MVTLQEVEQAETELTQAERELQTIAKQRIPERKFGFGVTPQYQKQVIQQRQTASEYLTKAQEERKNIEQVKKDVIAYESQKAEYQRQKDEYESQKERYELIRRLASEGKSARGLNLSKAEQEFYQGIKEGYYSRQKYNEQIKQFEAQGLKPVYTGGKLTGFEDTVLQMSIGLSEIPKLPQKELLRYEQAGIIQNVPKSEGISMSKAEQFKKQIEDLSKQSYFYEQTIKQEQKPTYVYTETKLTKITPTRDIFRPIIETPTKEEVDYYTSVKTSQAYTQRALKQKSIIPTSVSNEYYSLRNKIAEIYNKPIFKTESEKKQFEKIKEDTVAFYQKYYKLPEKPARLITGGVYTLIPETYGEVALDVGTYGIGKKIGTGFKFAGKLPKISRKVLKTGAVLGGGYLTAGYAIETTKKIYSSPDYMEKGSIAGDAIKEFYLFQKGFEKGRLEKIGAKVVIKEPKKTSIKSIAEVKRGTILETPSDAITAYKQSGIYDVRILRGTEYRKVLDSYYRAFVEMKGGYKNEVGQSELNSVLKSYKSLFKSQRIQTTGFTLESGDLVRLRTYTNIPKTSRFYQRDFLIDKKTLMRNIKDVSDKRLYRGYSKLEEIRFLSKIKELGRPGVVEEIPKSVWSKGELARFKEWYGSGKVVQPFEVAESQLKDIYGTKQFILYGEKKPIGRSIGLEKGGGLDIISDKATSQDFQSLSKTIKLNKNLLKNALNQNAKSIPKKIKEPANVKQKQSLQLKQDLKTITPSVDTKVLARIQVGKILPSVTQISKNIMKEKIKGVSLSSSAVSLAGLREKEKVKSYVIPQKTISIPKQKQVQKVKQVQLLKQPQVLRQPQMLRQSELLKQPQVLRQPQMLKQPQALRQKQLLRQTELLKQTQKQKEVVLPNPKIIPPIIKPPKEPRINLDRNIKMAIKSTPTEKGFKAFVLKGKKKVYVSSALPKLSALRKGEEVALKTLRATFGIEPAKQLIKKKDLSGYTPSKKIFREYRIKAGKKIPLKDTFIQRRGKRLVTKSEVKELQSYRKSRRKK